MKQGEDNDLKLAVMNAMWPLPCVNPSYTSEEELAYERKRCATWRAWAESDPQLDDRTRAAYLHWVEYCEYQNAEGEKELTLKTRERRHQEYLQRQAEQSQRVAQIHVHKPSGRF